MSGRGGGAYINGRYVANPGKGKGRGKGEGGGQGGGKGEGKKGGDDRYEKKPGDEDIALERKFEIDVLVPGESRIGYMFNFKPTRHYDDSGRQLSGLIVYFLQRDGGTFRATFVYRPYFFVQIGERDNFESFRDILAQRFQMEGVHVEIVDKEDLSMEDHIVGRKRKLLKLSFENDNGLNKARRDLAAEMKRQNKDAGMGFEENDRTSAMSQIKGIFEYDVPYVCRVCIDNKLNCGKWFTVTRHKMATGLDDIWDTQTTIVAKDDMLAKPGLRIFAYDIECTKEPLKFPDSAHDRITMISIMADGSGFLIVNRQEVSEDIEPLEYTPKPEYEGIFDTFNEPDEASLIRRFFNLIRETSPHVMVTFNGDFFDMPFVTNRARAYNIEWKDETGMDKQQEDFYCGKWICHLDCFCWVQRDSYLPCGARGLKAVTRYKLKYDPVELDPEDMTPFAKDRPQELAAYSVSDAVATYYLYMKYIHDFIFALCSIIPYGPDDVLRRGSGTLCESLLMQSAFDANVLFPNKHIDDPLEFHGPTNRLIEQSTYEGARVECMRVGVFRADIKETFQLEPSAFQVLLNNLKPTVDFFLTVEEKVKIEDVVNYQEILTEVEKQLRDLCCPDKVAAQIGRRAAKAGSPSKNGSKDEEVQDEYVLKDVEYEKVVGSGGVKSSKKTKIITERVVKEDYPLIYHLDVGAMYPNIILSNRLQPSAIVDKEFCAACSYNDPSNKCQREMDWKWRGELYMATRADVKSIMNEMENESRRYNQKDKDTGEMKRVKWSELGEKDRIAEITKAVRVYCQKAYSRLKSPVYEDRRDIVCQRENPFYVDTVLNFRDRRYVYKRKTKEWTKAFEKAEETGDLAKMSEAKDFMLLYDSLQLAHKCILNSFYGYVMRKGARWHSMRMAGIVTFTGSNLIRVAREFCEMVGLPIELDTDGIWCMLPKSFPDTFKFNLKNGKEIKMPYSNCILNYNVHEQYTNHQYQDRNKKTNEWETRSENSIFFEIDGPYKCMVLPASTEEDKFLKKRYAVYNFDGSLAELKGFEIKRRGELKLIQVFQEEVFPAFLKGTTKQEVWNVVGEMANRWLNVIESKGSTMTDDEVIYFISEAKSMSKSVEASGSHKSVQITCAKRLSQFLGVESLLTDAGVSCHMLISSKPHNASTTERAIPVKIFSAEYEVKKHWLRTWTEDPSLTDFDMRTIIDWAYYKERLSAVFLKLITIPAAFQKFSNPCPRVRMPEWLRKRVAEQNSKYQQRSLNAYWKKTMPGIADEVEAAKRKLGDLEDLAGNLGGLGGSKKGRDAPELPIVEFGKAPKRWLEVQRLRWEDSAGKTATLARSGGGLRSSLFHDGPQWSQLSPEAMRGVWHIVSIEKAEAPRSASQLRAGSAVVAQLDDDDAMGLENAEEPKTKQGHIVGFVGGMVRVKLDDGTERLLQRSSVAPLKEEGLHVVWALVEPGHTMHRFEVAMKRRVVLALESSLNPEDARQVVRASELIKGLRVWPREPDEKRVGPGIVKTASPEVGLCGVTWASGETEVAFCEDLQRESGSMSVVTKDPPRNLRHACLVEQEMDEGDFQQQRGEGALGDRDGGWPRIDAIYEGEQSLDFDLICRLGLTVRLASPERAEENPRVGAGLRLRLEPQDLKTVSGKDLTYLPGLAASKNVYVHLCFDRVRPARCFCGIFAPALDAAWVCFGGLDEREGEDKRAGIEHLISEQLSAEHGSHCTAGSLPTAVHVEVAFVGKSLTALVKWADNRLQEIRRKDGGVVMVLCSQLPTADLQGLAPSLWVEQRQLKHITALKEMAICRAPFEESDADFPLLDWSAWIGKLFAVKVPVLFNWWRGRLALCRAGAMPICNAPEKAVAAVPAALDAMYARQLTQDNQLRWASGTCRPDLGDTALSLTDTQEESLLVVDSVLQGGDLSAGRGGGQVNNAGMYRSVCLEVNLRTKLCICALLHARYLSDMEGGELSRKLVRKVAGADGRNLDHTSEASITNFESLINLVQHIADVRDARAEEIATLKQRWAASSEGAANDIAPDDDERFVQAMREANLENAILENRLEELRLEHDAQNDLLDGLYGWLASPTSQLYDGALLRKVHQYMDRVLQLLLNVLKRNGCEIIFASYNRVLFATGKLRVVPDVQHFWDALCENVSTHKPLGPLNLSDVHCLSELFYGVMWLDPTNWAGVPINPESGEVEWKARSQWKMAEFLPPAVRPSLQLYAGELLIGPQQELQRRYIGSALAGAEEEADDAAAMEVDQNGEEAAEGDGDDGAPPAEATDAAAKEKEAAAAAQAGGSVPDATHTAKVLEDVRTFVCGDFFGELRLRILRYVDGIQLQQAQELPQAASRRREPTERWKELSDEEDDDVDADGPGARERRAEQLRWHLEQKWSFPDMPGRRSIPGAVDFEFMRALVQIYQLEDCLLDQVHALRDRLCQKMKVSAFAKEALKFETPCFPLVLKDVLCPSCCMASHVDVVSHPVKSPGLWVCVHCKNCYDKDAMQAKLVGLLEHVVQAWQSQEVVCMKCKKLRNGKLQNFCECFGRFQVRYKEEEFRLVLKMLRSCVEPHDLPWLGQMLSIYESALS
eukprot:TRINITY_DN27061_c1_g1_i1.p1 TRINITY_DN27061_c1_g1~~TRINITY_DN27061_c1_g1_i1.p1  ORF type:complete len:2570 (-),score=762.48 TRINITY_DN27061_c1_g1_i1:128-7837(-)